MGCALATASAFSLPAFTKAATADGPVTPVAIEQAVESVAGVDLAAAVGVGPPGTQQVVLVLAPSDRPKRADLAPIALVASVAACDIDVPDLNNPGVDSLEDNPTPSAVSAAATGLLIGNRVGIGNEAGYVSHLGILGRESWNFDGADPRYTTELLQGIFDPGGGAFGGNFWTAPYANIKSGFTLLHALDKVQGMTDAQKEATRGFAGGRR